MGMRKQNEYKQHPEITVNNSASNCSCVLFVCNLTLRTDFKIPFVTDAIQKEMHNHRSNSNTLLQQLLQAHNNRRGPGQ
jgi:hypothetical protein